MKKDKCPMCRRQILYTIPDEIKTYMQIYRNIQKDNNNQSGLDINDIEEFPPL